MPYIAQERRREIDQALTALLEQPMTVGELNYACTRLLLRFVERAGGVRYDACNALIGVLECCKLELYRRLVGPYEDEKVRENGDVYPSK